MSMSSQDIIDKQWFYNRARTCPIIHACIKEHEHNGLSWASTLATMAKYLSEANESKSRKIAELLTYAVMPIINTTKDER